MEASLVGSEMCIRDSLYPWAVAFNRLGLLAFIEALIFIAILVIALAYAWRKGALEWS